MAGAEDSDVNGEKTTQAYAALGVGFVFIVIGVPLWWKTTEVYRVSLPYSDITSLSQTQIDPYITFTVVAFDNEWTKAELASVGEQLKNTFSSKSHSSFHVRYKGNLRDADTEESEALNKSKSLEDLDKEFHKLYDIRPSSGYTVVVLPKSHSLNVGKGFLGLWKTAFLQIASADLLADAVQHIIRDVYVDEPSLLKVYRKATSNRNLKTDKESMRSLRYHPGYDVTLTLLNPQPDVVNAHWKIQQGVDAYLSHLVKSFGEYSTITVKSQYLHYTTLSIRPKKVSKGEFYSLSVNDLPHIINPIEAHLNSHVSTNPQINFIIYIPTREQSPLHILDSKGSLQNAFLSPRWGGMMVYNVDGPAENVSLPFYHEVDMKHIMEVVISQLRLLMGITPPTTGDLNIRQPGNLAVTSWELESWLRRRAVENVVTATATLRSLTQLLDQVRNIVINDNIATEVERGVNNIGQCHKDLQEGRLHQAFATARQAILSSEKAFFDPSLLELLYFPEDQKFAIYIPLFLPISIPVLLSLVQAVRWLKAQRQPAHIKTD